jgi:hypothetical protein
MASDNKAPVPTSLYAIEIYDAKTGSLDHVLAHPVRATSPQMAVWEAVQAYAFKIRHWRLEAVPAQTHFPRTEAAA